MPSRRFPSWRQAAAHHNYRKGERVTTEDLREELLAALSLADEPIGRTELAARVTARKGDALARIADLIADGSIAAEGEGRKMTLALPGEADTGTDAEPDEFPEPNAEAKVNQLVDSVPVGDEYQAGQLVADLLLMNAELQTEVDNLTRKNVELQRQVARMEADALPKPAPEPDAIRAALTELAFLAAGGPPLTRLVGPTLNGGSNGYR